MVASERKVTHTLLLLVFTVGGATLPQNLRRRLRFSATYWQVSRSLENHTFSI